MEVGDVVVALAGWTRKGQIGIITKFSPRKRLPDEYLVYFANTEKKWDWFPCYELEVLCK